MFWAATPLKLHIQEKITNNFLNPIHTFTFIEIFQHFGNHLCSLFKLDEKTDGTLSGSNGIQKLRFSSYPGLGVTVQCEFGTAGEKHIRMCFFLSEWFLWICVSSMRFRSHILQQWSNTDTPSYFYPQLTLCCCCDWTGLSIVPRQLI